MKLLKDFDAPYWINKKGIIFNGRGPLTGNINAGGYLIVKLKYRGGRKPFRVNRLVALTYIPNPHNYPMVLHLDNNPLNNKVSNLKWGTAKMNAEQRENEGRSKRRSPNTIRPLGLTWDKVREIRTSTLKNRQLSEKYNISYSYISSIKKYRSWKEPLILE